MVKVLARFAIFLFALLPLASEAEPITLKLSYYSSDRSATYLQLIKPFVDAVNGDGQGFLNIQVYFSGALGRLQAQQPQLVDDDVADIALIIIGQTPERFEDSTVIELPGLFRDARETTLIYNRLIATNALEGYEHFFVIAAFTADPNSIHTRQPVASLADLKGMKIRVNNQIEASGLERLGIVPVVLALPQTLDAISKGTIDGATTPPSILFDFGLARVTAYHYLLLTSAAPQALVMNRNKFDSLPDQAKALIRKHCGEWLIGRYLASWEPYEKQELDRIESGPWRHVIIPSAQDLAVCGKT